VVVSARKLVEEAKPRIRSVSPLVVEVVEGCSAKVGVVPVQHPKCAQRVPATGVPVAVLHREVHRAAMGVLQ
jgi:hypothetical protein